MSPWRIKHDSYHKCLIYFADGTPRTFFSLDWVSQNSPHRNAELGLKRLRTLIAKYGDLALTAIIYDLATNQPIEQYAQGVKIK